jgi:hypothetical protein
MRLCEHPDFAQAILRAAEHFKGRGLRPVPPMARMHCLPLLLACCAFAGCRKEPDLARTPTDALLRLAAAPDRHDSPDSLARRADAAWCTRPEAEREQSLRSACADPAPRVRAWAGSKVIDWLADPTALQPESRRADFEAALANLFADADPQVQEGVVAWLPLSQFQTPGPRCLEAMAGAIRNLLTASTPRERFFAVLAASHFASDLPTLAPAILAETQSEPDRGVRFMTSVALPKLAPRDPAVAERLCAMLDDPEEEVRYGAAVSLGDTVSPATAVVQRLHRTALDATESGQVRASAALSLAKVAMGAEAGQAALEALFAVEVGLENSCWDAWLNALGRAAAWAPSGVLGISAQQRLADAARSEEAATVRAARGGLLRVAYRSGDGPRGRATLAPLLAELPDLRTAAAGGDMDLDSFAVLRSVMEPLVDVVAWPELAIDAGELRAAVEPLQRHKFRWVRAWAVAQLARLPA